MIKAAFLKNWTLFLVAIFFAVHAFARNDVRLDEISANQLPQEARQTLVLIKKGGPFPYAKDGAVFGNYERILPKQKRGYYREFTVKTPGARNRGARRIVAGGDPPSFGEYYYTDDHYATFQRIRE